MLPAGEAHLDPHSRLGAGIEGCRDGVVEDPVQVWRLGIEDHLRDGQDGGALGIGPRELGVGEPVQEGQLPLRRRGVTRPARHGPAVVPSRVMRFNRIQP